MIGAASFITELLSFLIPLSLFLSALYLTWFKKQKGGYLFAALTGLALLVMGGRYICQVSNHVLLNHLSADDVAEIQIGKSIVSQQSDVGRVVEALNESRWFSSNHGGWAEAVPLVIRMKNGQAHRFGVGYYLRQEGAVIEFHRDWGSVRLSDGYGFSGRLPSVLKQVGILLPSQS